MAKKKDSKVEEKVEKKEKTEKKDKVITIASVFQELGQQGAKSRSELAQKIIDYLAGKGITTNVKGKEIKKERVAQQVCAMIRDINNKRGADKNSWWSQLRVEEDKEHVKLIKQ